MAKSEEPVLGSSATIVKSSAEKKAEISGKSEKEVLQQMCYSLNTIKMWVMILAISFLSFFLIDLIFKIINAIQFTHIK